MNKTEINVLCLVKWKSLIYFNSVNSIIYCTKHPFTLSLCNYFGIDSCCVHAICMHAHTYTIHMHGIDVPGMEQTKDKLF